MARARSGDRAPLIALTDQNGTERRSDQLDGRALVLFFYPKDDTPGCTMEACAFRDSYAEFEKLGCEIFGVSRDTLKSHENFRAKQDFPFDLVADKEEELCNAMEVIKKTFTPEFRNRLDAIIQFKQLGPDTISQVVDKFLFELEGQLEEKGVTLEVDTEARTWLAIHGYDPNMGARPMA